MVEAYEGTLPYRIAAGVTFFLVLAIRDWILHPNDPRRVKEYLLLVFAMGVAVAYGIAHDHITATISPDYFLAGKGLAGDPRPFRWAVTLLAMKAAYGPGLIVGAAMLIANNPSPGRPQLPYTQMVRLCGYPIAGAVIGAALAAATAWLLADVPWLHATATDFATEQRAVRFLVTWGMHAGSYGGATLGTVLAVGAVVRRRSRIATSGRKSAFETHLETP